jgi:uncharacterized membrane protein
MRQRIGSLDLLRGLVMIVMALDHVRDYFHKDAFLYSPTDMGKTNAVLFFTRWVTHFCAPVFVFLAGVSACLYGARRGRKALAWFLVTRGIWLVFVELFVVSLLRTFNLSFAFFNLQVIWAIGVGMMVLAGLIYLRREVLLLVAVALVAGHNLLDGVHVDGSFVWACLHETKSFGFGHRLVTVKYPVLPWIGIIAFGYFTGRYYLPDIDARARRSRLFTMGVGAIGLFIALRFVNGYGDPHPRISGSFLSFFNVTKYPPSLLYALVTLGPALIFLAMAEGRDWGERVAVFGRTAMFYYLAHILLIHVLALAGVVVCGRPLSDMVLTMAVDDQPELKGYGFPLVVVYLIWIGLLFMLYPLCKWYDGYKRANQASKWWLSYI